MDKIDVKNAVNECQRFIKRANDYFRRLDRESDQVLLKITGCKESGAVKRASMDVTRVMAKLRGYK